MLYALTRPIILLLEVGKAVRQRKDIHSIRHALNILSDIIQYALSEQCLSMLIQSWLPDSLFFN